MPRRPDPDGDRRRAIDLAAKAAKKARTADRQRDAAIRFAVEEGASLREVAEATELGHMTVKRIAERQAEEA